MNYPTCCEKCQGIGVPVQWETGEAEIVKTCSRPSCHCHSTPTTEKSNEEILDEAIADLVAPTTEKWGVGVVIVRNLYGEVLNAPTTPETPPKRGKLTYYYGTYSEAKRKSLPEGSESADAPVEKPIIPDKKDWGADFNRHVQELGDDMPKEGESGPTRYFGYKINQNRYLWVVTDWGNIKAFITNLLNQQREQVEVLFEAKYQEGFADGVDTERHRISVEVEKEILRCPKHATMDYHQPDGLCMTCREFQLQNIALDTVLHIINPQPTKEV